MSPTGRRHFEQARWNLAVAQQLLRDHGGEPPYVQWAVTAAFYCGVHCIQGYLIDRGRDPKTHLRRADEIADPANHIPADVDRAYEWLKQLSEKARYRLGTFDPAWVQRTVLDTRLKTITDFVGL